MKQGHGFTFSAARLVKTWGGQLCLIRRQMPKYHIRDSISFSILVQ